MKGKVASLILALGLAATGCGSPPADPASAPAQPAAAAPAPLPEGGLPCEPAGTRLSILAPSTSGQGVLAFTFDRDCLAAPVGKPFTIELRNESTPHNLSIYTDETATARIFFGPNVSKGESMRYEVDAIEQPGLYFFRCDLHPIQMTGTLVVA